MPTYSYQCTECGNRFDIVQAFTDDALTTCDQCSGRLRKLFNSVGVVFKGSGFYRTDSRESASKSKAASNGSNGSSASDSGANSSSDKPASSEKNGSGDSKSAASSTTSTPSKAAAAT